MPQEAADSPEGLSQQHTIQGLLFKNRVENSANNG